MFEHLKHALLLPCKNLPTAGPTRYNSALTPLFSHANQNRINFSMET